MKLNKFFFLVSILFLMPLSCTFHPKEEKVEERVSLTEGQMDLELKSNTGETINLKDLRGKVIFLNFWGSWCPPCRFEMPSIQKLYDAYNGKVAFVLVAMNEKEGEAEAFIAKNKYTFPFYEAHSPIDAELLPKGFPTTLIIDKNGEVIVKEVGAKDWYGTEAKEILEKLLK